MSVPQPLLFPLDANCNGVFRNRPISPSGLLDASISEEVRQGQGLEEEREPQEPLSGGTGRRHTLAEVSACFSPSAPPCKCPVGQERGPGHRPGGGRAVETLTGRWRVHLIGWWASDCPCPDLPFALTPRPRRSYFETARGPSVAGQLGV